MNKGGIFCHVVFWFAKRTRKITTCHSGLAPCSLYNSSWRLSIHQSNKKPPPDPSSCSAVSVQYWNRLSLLYTWPGTNFAAALSTGNMGDRVGSLCYSNATLVISQLMSSPLLFFIGNTWLWRCCCCCRCHILICSPLWKTLVLINFTFMVCTHNKREWGAVVYQHRAVFSNL